MFKVSKSIPEDDDQEQPTKPKQRKPYVLKSPLFAVYYIKMEDVETGPGHFLAKCNYCSKTYNFQKGGGYGTLNSHIKRHHPDKIGIESNPNDCVQHAKNALSALYKEYACNYSGSLDLGMGSSSPVHIPSSSSSISSFGFAISDLGEWDAYQEDLSRKRTRYQSNAYQELENYLATFDLGALERGPDGNNNLLKWWAKRSTIFPVVATIAKEILDVPS
ncbi:hypothetical protein OROHE_001178 [Orobanche hederae]